MQVDYYAELQSVLPGEHKTIGGKAQIVPSICPFCGKSNEREMHSSYGAIFVDGANGYKCFACGESSSLSSLYETLTGKKAAKSAYTAPILPSKARQTPNWRKHSQRHMKAFAAHSSRYTAWLDYKHIPKGVVDKYQLGVGVLPQSRYRDTRLIVPVIQNDRVSMLRGRRIGSGDSAKWASSGGVSPADIQLPFHQYVNTDIIFIVENPVDAILINEFSRASAVCSLSTNYWYPHWTNMIKELKPSIVITAYDADIAGEGVGIEQVISTVKERVAKIFAARGVELENVIVTGLETTVNGWRVSWKSGENGGVLPIPAPAGVQRRNALIKAGIQVASMPWNDVKDKCDIGDLWMRESVDNGI